MRISFLDGIKKEAMSAWIKKLLKLSSKSRMALLRNWNQKDAVRLLGEGARNITRKKAAYKLLSNKARFLAMKANPAPFLTSAQKKALQTLSKTNKHWAGHGMKHVGDVTSNMQAVTKARKVLPGLKLSHNAITDQAIQRRGVFAGMLHDLGKGSEKLIPNKFVKSNLRKYHHQFQGARRAREFFNRNKELSELAGIGGKSGVTDIVRAIRGHNPAGWRFSSVKKDAFSPLGSLLRTADDVAGNLGNVGVHRTIFNKFTKGNTLAEKARNAWAYARGHNQAPYKQIVADAPAVFRPYAQKQYDIYFNTLNRASKMKAGASNPYLIDQVSKAGLSDFTKAFQIGV